MHKIWSIPVLALLAVVLLAACQPVHPVTPEATDQPVTPVPTDVSAAKVEADPAAANRLLQEGVKYHDAGDYDKAVDAFTEAIELNPDLADAYVKRAAAYLRLGKNEEALADSDEAIRLNPAAADGYFYRGVAHAYLDEFDAAVPDLTEAIRLDPSSINAHVYRGGSYFFLGQYAAAVQDCIEAVHLSDGYFLPAETCLNIMGKLTSPDFEHVDAAIQDYDEAIRADPEFAGAYFIRGLTKRSAGDIEGAILDLEEALRLDPPLWDLLLMYWSMAYMNPPDPDAAIEELETALALATPDSVLANIIEDSLGRIGAIP